ncbi:DUF2087 domain-containing protein [Paenibacillus tepidiphilus]|uniref:DUF2087 domain-containing protein n=1 Tax=Paenibacillus tepidiphilus TaxID=2608683 RepID=UPI001EF0193D|nr:DUF2087 domain-containing protein [Paenibacillus tepidiphilus]
MKELKLGYVAQTREPSLFYTCLVCGEEFEKGVIYKRGEQFYEAEKFAGMHVAEAHGTMFHWLLGLDKKQTGLTDLQKGLIQSFAQGQSDNEAAEALGIGSTSTVRNHRFTLREKVKQAKLFLAIMELAEEKPRVSAPLLSTPRSGAVQDKQIILTEEEYAEIIGSYFKEGPDGPLAEFPRKHKRRAAILRQLIQRFMPGRDYTEKEVNAILEEAFDDYVLLRRYLIDYGLLAREEDGSRYWVRTQTEDPPKNMNTDRRMDTMDKNKRKELGYNYAHTHRPMGVYRIYNSINGKSLVGSSMNLDGAWNKHKFMLDAGLHDNKALQADWKEYGSGNVVFEILEQIKPEEDFVAEASETLKYRKPLAELEEKWLEKLAPYGDNGYHKQR